MNNKSFDTFHMGRSSIDLYANDVGAPFVDIKSFAAYVGGSPTNISVGVSRLGLNSGLLTGFGEDPVGDFIENFLNKEGVNTKYSPRLAGRRSSAVLLGIEPPDKFPLVFYRENCADLGLTIDHVLQAPIEKSKFFQFAGTNLSQDPSRSATIFAADLAQSSGVKVVLDIDFRPDQWHDPRAFGVAIRSVLRSVDIVIGTEDEINAAVLTDTSAISLTDSQVSDASVEGDTLAAIETLLSMGPGILIEKVGALGARIHLKKEDESIECTEVPGFPVEVYNILGAGDAFGAGFLFGLVKEWDLYKAARFGNACGALVVMAHGCANFMPTFDEVIAFTDEFGGL